MIWLPYLHLHSVSTSNHAAITTLYVGSGEVEHSFPPPPFSLFICSQLQFPVKDCEVKLIWKINQEQCSSNMLCIQTRKSNFSLIVYLDVFVLFFFPVRSWKFPFIIKHITNSIISKVLQTVFVCLVTFPICCVAFYQPGSVQPITGAKKRNKCQLSMAELYLLSI